MLRVPVAVALGLACLPMLVIEPRLSPLSLFNETFKAYNSFILLAVPFFLLTANLMNSGGITDRLVHLSRTMVGNFPGALAQVNVLLSVFFAGISGSSTADAASQSKMFIEAQTKEGYDLSFSVAITAVSAILAVIIPPSILMIVWGGVLTVSIGALFLAGIIPGPAARRRADGDRARVREAARLPGLSACDVARVLQGVPGLRSRRSLTPFIIIGGIRMGWFTPTESAGIAVIYAALLSFLVYREMTVRKFFHALAETGRLSSVALFCVGTASVFGWLLAYYQIPRALLENVTSWGMGIIGVGFFIAAVFLVVGCFLDAIPAIIIVGTVLQPLANSVQHAPGALRHHRHRLARLRPGDAALWPVPDDRVRGRQGAIAIRHEGRHDHAGADAGRAGRAHHLAGDLAVPAEAHLAGVPQVSAAGLFSLDGRMALVIGGTSGIGKAIAEGYTAAGAEVVIAGRDAGKLASAAAALSVTGYAADVKDIAQLGSLVETVLARPPSHRRAGQLPGHHDVEACRGVHA